MSTQKVSGVWWLVAAVAAGFVVLASPEHSTLELAVAALWAGCLVLWTAALQSDGKDKQ